MYMTEDEIKMIRSLRDKGFAIVIFTPEELAGVPPVRFEASLVGAGSDALDVLRPEFTEYD